MADSHRRKLDKREKLDPRAITVEFAPEVMKALADLDAAVKTSSHFDGDMYAILHEWVTGEAKPTVRDAIVDLPLIADETFRYIQATSDKRAEDAWDQLCEHLVGKQITLTQRVRQR